MLEDLRLLTNYEMDSKNRLCLLLVGQAELRRRVGMAVHEALSQRIVVRHHVGGLTRDELSAYLGHLLRLTGTELPLFEPPALEAIQPRDERTPAQGEPARSPRPHRRHSRQGPDRHRRARPGRALGDHVTACGVWLGRRGLAAVLVDGGGRVCFTATLARADARAGASPSVSPPKASAALFARILSVPWLRAQLRRLEPEDDPRQVPLL